MSRLTMKVDIINACVCYMAENYYVTTSWLMAADLKEHVNIV
jgi:hypothetical protein